MFPQLLADSLEALHRLSPANYCTSTYRAYRAWLAGLAIGGSNCRAACSHLWRQESPLDLAPRPVLGLAAGGCAYAAMWPDSQIFGATLIAPPRPGELALTFDDGPNPAWTPRLLDLLASHDVRDLLHDRQLCPGPTGAGAADRRSRTPHRQPLLEPSQPGAGFFQPHRRGTRQAPPWSWSRLPALRCATFVLPLARAVLKCCANQGGWAWFPSSGTR